VKTALVLQVRLDSSRLPGKALLPLGGKPLIARVMERLTACRAGVNILACPDDDASRAAFEPLARAAGFEVFCGSKLDVLGRFCAAIKFFALDGGIIRATGDNPFVFADAARALVREAAALDADYAAFAGLPYGAGVEVVSARALLRAGEAAATEAEREHVCPYLYGHPELFTLHRPLCPRKWRAPNVRLTVDTPEDYRHASELAAILGNGSWRGVSGERLIKKASLLAK
jgi:spore coat polysaccharide biosynthesis protein SpsF